MSGAIANQVGEAVCGKSETAFGGWAKLEAAIRSAWPKKTAANMAAYTGLLVRSCETFLSRKSSLSSDAVVGLLDTEHGPEFLLALVGHSKQPWIADFKARWQIEKLKKERAVLDAKIEALSRGELP
jgi:hypothetical protein